MKLRALPWALAFLVGALAASWVIAGNVADLRGQRSDRDLVLAATVEGWSEAAEEFLGESSVDSEPVQSALDTDEGPIGLVLYDADEMVVASSDGTEVFDPTELRVAEASDATLLGRLEGDRHHATRRFGDRGQWVIVAIADDADFVTAEDRFAVLALRWVVIAVPLAALALAAIRPVARRVQTIYDRATLDAITGLANRSAITTALRKPLGRQGEPVALAIVDLDDFKPVNDTWGHRIGDEALRTVGDRLRQFADDHDMVAGRLGGDEFLVVATGPSALDADDAWNNLVDSMAVPFDVRGHEIRIGASVGVVHVGAEDERSVEHALSRADRALYGVKRRGGNGWLSTIDVIDARDRATITNGSH